MPGAPPSCGNGSPPPLRGTDEYTVLQGVLSRITPAPAGNSPARWRYMIGIQDHPRPCGEQMPNPAAATNSIGSPPPLRGTGTRNWTGGWTMGITPAPAGNSPGWCSMQVEQRDHPRPCGEQGNYAQTIAGQAGSPPPLRGTEYMVNYTLHGYRITPAPAGNREAKAAGDRVHEDHPRPCGEQLFHIMGSYLE